jgi:RNA polymerase sigma factor (sigma-70 family)
MAAANLNDFLRRLTRGMAAGMLGDNSDRHLVERALAARDEAAFEAIVHRHGPMVYRVCWRVLQHSQDAEDAFQATFLVLAQKLHRLGKHASLASWLHGVAHRVALKARAQAAARRQRECRAALPDTLPPDEVTWGELRSALDLELSLLPDRWRLPLILCYLEGRTQDETASQLGWSKSTLRRRLEEAREALGSRLKGRGIVWPAALSAVLVSDCTASVAPAPGLVAFTVEVAAGVATGQTVTTAASAPVASLTEGVMKTMLMDKLKIGILILVVMGLAATGTGLVAHQVAVAMQQKSQADNAEPSKLHQAESADNQAKRADAEMHVIGVYGAKTGFGAAGGRVEVAVRPTSMPVVLVLTSYYAVDWHIKLADGARIKKVIVSGYNAQEISGLPADVPMVNRSYFPADGSRRKQGWFYAHEWNTPPWREMVRRLNEMTGLPVASFQGKYQGDSFLVDGTLGRDFGQKRLQPRAPGPKELTLQELRATSADAELNVVGISSPADPGKPVAVEVRATAKPVVLVLTSSSEAVWNVKRAEGARIKAVLVAGDNSQEVDGIPDDVPVRYFCPDASCLFEGIRSQRDRQQAFNAYQGNTLEYRRMVQKLNDLTGLRVATFQGEEKGTAFVVDGTRGRHFAHKERKPRPTLPKEPTPQELRAASAGADLHVVGPSGAGAGNGAPIDVEVRPTTKPVVLALTSYSSVLWNVRIAPGARVKAVIIVGYFEQEFEGIPANIPLVCRSYFPADGSRRKQGWFYPGRWNTPPWREMVRRLNEMTGLPVASFQGESKGDSFLVDGTLGRDFGQKGLKPRARTPKEPTPQELRAASANAELHVVGIYTPDMHNPGKPVDVEVQSTAKPVLLVLTSYMEAIWNVKRAEGARIKAVIVGSPMPQEIEGLPTDVPVCYFCPDGPSFYFDRRGSQQDKESFFAYQGNTFEYRRTVAKLNDLTGLLVSTFQGEYSGTSFVVDGARGRNFAQKERKPRQPLPKEPTPQELLAASADADLHVVSIYGTDAGNGAPVDVEVRPTAKPIVLALASYQSVLWNVKIAPGARVKAVIIGGYFEQEFEGIPAHIPIVYRAYFPSQKQGFYYAYQGNTIEYRRMVEQLNDLTGLLVATSQVANTTTSQFVVDGTRGSHFAQKERNRDVAKQQPKSEEDPLADVADIPAQELQAAGDANKRYFLIGPKKNAKPPAEGYGLLVIMPGGDGSADFHPFVKRIYKYALSDRYLAAQPIAIKWTPNQEIVWPTKTNPVTKMKFSTEAFVEAVIEEVAKKHKIDRRRIFTLSWSSSGPAAYATSLRNKRAITGSFIAMSVFNPQFLPPLKGAKGHAYYLYHSPEDRVCPYRMAEEAKTSLAENGAKVRLETYQGGHGWRGNVYNDIRQGVAWLEKNQETPSRP